MTNDSLLHGIERRRFLRAAGMLGAGSLMAGPIAALVPRALASSCTLTLTDAQGPFYLNNALVRSDITEGRPGLPLHLVLRVVRASDCAPVAGAVVDVWQTGVAGRYSGIPSEGTAGQTFMRGIQLTTATGIACFRTVFPGWYLGRTAHIHVKINPNLANELTTQLYFRPGLIETVYEHAPYALRGPSPTDNDSDPLYRPELVLTGYPLGIRGIGAPPGAAQQLVAGKTIVIA